MFESYRNWRLAAGILLLVSAVCALFQLDRYPLESHEIFVAQTAREPVLMPFCLLLAAAVERLFSDSAHGAGLRRWLAVAIPSSGS